jgi:formylglycine-generating enzyme required for sulfatase activity
MRLGEMVRVPAGTFALGSEEGDGDEAPVRTVSVRSFVIDVHEVTQREYAARMGKAPSYFENCPACPVENVSWKEAKRFCEQGGKRLPTEAEWEYAARAGSETVYYWGDEFDERYAWYDGNSRGRTMPVGRKKPNRWGLYDMLGNVWEWCADRYARDYYEQGGDTDPRGPDRGSNRVVRGGAWYYGERSLRSANRESYPPDYRYRTIGFRCAADAPASTPEHNTPSRDSRSQSNH